MTDEKPLTEDAELAELEYRCQQEAAKDEAGLEPPFVSAKLALRLVAEVQRLRDEQHSAAVVLAPWIQHHSSCARVTEASDCSCGVNDALRRVRRS